ncbi:MAG: beta strand repeat-containing protein, partial [Terriglobales bacterium]
SSVNAGLTDQFSASVGPSGISQSVTWQVNGTTGGDTANGTISTSGLYQAPSAPPAGGTVTITATSATGSVVSAAYSLTIAPAITVSIAAQGTPPSVLVAGSSETFAAAVANTTNQNVNWQVNGVPGGNATVGLITTAGVYTAPKLLPPGGGVAITATAQADPNASSSGISITDGWANGSLQGTYVFAVQGTDGAGCTFAEVGQFTADGTTNAQGNGNITGEADFNTTTANGCPGTDVAATAGNVTGTYQIAPNGTGGIQFSTSPEGVSMVYAIVLDASGNARLIEEDANASVSGSVWAQSSTAAPSGAYVFGVPPDQIGLITAASNAWTGTEDIDINNAGTITPDAGVTGTFTNPDASGRATMTLTEGATTENYVYYAISASRFELVRSDNGIVAIGRADTQASGVDFSQGLLSGNCVFQDAGTQALSPGTGFSAAGQFTAGGSGNIPAGASLDVRTGTSNQSGQTFAAGSYTASASADGEYTVTLGIHTYYIWMYSATGGEILQADGQGNAQGTVAQQQNGPFSDGALYGEYALQMTGGTGTGGATTVVLQGELAALNGELAGQGDSVVGGTVNNGGSGGALYLVGTYTVGASGEATGTLMACSGSVAPSSAACPTGDTQVFTTTLDFWIGTAGQSSAGTTASGRAFLTAAPGGTYWQGTLTQQY